MKLKDKLKQLPGSWYFLGIVILGYILLSMINKEIYLSSLVFFGDIILKVIPILILILVLMSISNYFITSKFVMKHLSGKGLKKWFFVILGGILSSGPIYMWYPLLADLREKGLSYGMIACFLYNRAIKIPLIPLAIIYFSWQYILVLSMVMIVISIIQAIILDKFMEVKK